VLKYKKITFVFVLIVLGSFILGLLLITPSPLDAVEAYQKQTSFVRQPPEAPATLSLSPTTPKVLLVTAQEETVIPVSFQQAVETTTAAASIPKGTAAASRPEEARALVFSVPFYSQFADITSPTWKKVGCGIASLAMLIEFHTPGKLSSVDTLLEEGIDAKAYSDAGWTYAGLIKISKKYGLFGETHDFGTSNMDTAFRAFEKALAKGPVMASVHYTFDPKNPIPHLVIITGVKEGMIHYNDPAEKKGGGSITITKFQNSWKKRYIEFYPAS
jgi:hypothetical protein